MLGRPAHKLLDLRNQMRADFFRVFPLVALQTFFHPVQSELLAFAPCLDNSP